MQIYRLPIIQSHVASRGPSVVSRNLQKIAEDHPVLKKIKGCWELTPLGIQVNEQTKSYLKNHTELFLHSKQNKTKKELELLEDSVLVVINAQKGLIDLTQEGRNNLEAEKNIVQILKLWRNTNRKIIHVKYISNNPESTFFQNSLEADFLDSVRPHDHEPPLFGKLTSRI